MLHNKRHEPRPYGLNSKFTRLEKRKRVTLIAGFRCNGGMPGGVVLCADSYEGDGLSKTEVNKLAEYRSDWCTVGIAGAGDDSDVIEATIERIVDELEDFKPATETDIKAAVREALKDLPETSRPANLLIAACPSNNPRAVLWTVANRHLHSVTNGRDIRGIGSVVGFVAEQLYRPEVTLYQGVLLSVHLLRLGNRHVEGVSGPSRVLVLTDGGWLVQERTDKIEQHESVFNQLDVAESYIYLPFADTSITSAEFEGRLTAFTETIRSLRQTHFEEFKDAHLSMAINDPSYQGDPYQTLPNDARSHTQSQWGYIGVGYRFEETPEGASGWAAPLQKKAGRASRAKTDAKLKEKP